MKEIKRYTYDEWSRIGYFDQKQVKEEYCKREYFLQRQTLIDLESLVLEGILKTFDFYENEYTPNDVKPGQLKLDRITRALAMMFDPPTLKYEDYTFKGTLLEQLALRAIHNHSELFYFDGSRKLVVLLQRPARIPETELEEGDRDVPN